MPSVSLNNALNSNKPSSIGLQQWLQRRKESRSVLARGNSAINTGIAEQLAIQKEHSIDYGANVTLPPLRGTVKPLETTNPNLLGSDSEEDDPQEETNTMARENFTTLKRLGKLDKEGKTVKVSKEDWDVIFRELRSKYNTILELEKGAKESACKVAKLESQVKEQAVTVEQLSDEVVLLEKQQPKKKGKNKSNNRKDEAKSDIVKAINGYVKSTLFRTVKFAQPGPELQKVTEKVYIGIKDDYILDKGPNPLTLEDFTEIYESTVLTALSGRRQYTQTRCEVAISEWWETHENDTKSLPTLAEMENVWSIPEHPDRISGLSEAQKKEAQAKYDRALEVLTWYLDSYLPMVAGLEHWGLSIRPFNLMTDKVDIDGSGKEKVLVTVTSEAFGLLLFANCREKWIVDHEFRLKHKKGTPLPVYKKSDPLTHKYRNKWSSSRTGQVQGGGWHNDAYIYFENAKKRIKEFRAAEKERDNALFKMGQELIRAANDLDMDAAPKTNGKTAGNKRPRQDGPEVQVVNLTFEEE